VYENIGAIFSPYESVSLRIIEPLNSSLHFVSPLAGDSFYSWGGSENNRRHEHELRGVYQNGLASQYSEGKKNSTLCIFIQKIDLNRSASGTARQICLVSEANSTLEK
jgi:hypothetical protein